MEPVELPRGVDDSHQFLFRSMDEAVVMIVLIGVGMLAEQLTVCLLLSWGYLRLLRRYRDNRPDGYLYHAVYWWGLLPAKGYSMVNPYRRRFLP